MQWDNAWTNPYTGGAFNSPGASFVDTMILHSIQRKMLYRSLLKKKGYSEREIDTILKRPEKEIKAIAGAKRAPIPQGAPNSGPATRFKPTGGRLMLEPFVASLAKTAEQKEALRRLFVQIFNGYEGQARKYDFPYDLAGALTFYITVHYSAFHDGLSISDRSTLEMLRQLRTAFDTDALRRVSSTDKQKLYEALVMLAGFTLALSESAGDERDTEKGKLRRQIGGDGLKLLRIDPTRVKVTDAGLEIAG